MALTYTPSAELGSEAKPFRLASVDGRKVGLEDFSDAKALVVVFMCNHCPYVIAVQERINALAREYQARGVALVGINSNDSEKYPEDSLEAMKVRAKEQGFVFPYLHDETQSVARAYGAVCTPDFFVFAPKSKGHWSLSYRGRLDDNWKQPTKVKRRDLALALDEILAGRSPSADQQASMGCSIKWK